MAATAPAAVLDGIRVLDFSRVFAGPSATQTLGDFGADIIKVEEPHGGDSARTFGVTQEVLERFGVSPSYLALNRNKRSIVLDLKSPAGQETAQRLAEQVDVVIHNFRPGAMQRLNLGYEALTARNPRIIYCEFSAFGQTGPLAHIGANDVALQAHSGLMSITGEPDRPASRCGTSVVDLHGGLAAVAGILAALLHRERTGEGQRVETSLLMSSAHLMSYFYTDYWMTGRVHQRMGTANHLTVPNQVFPSADGHVVIIAPTDDMWQRCAAALDPVLDRPEFKTAFQRRQQRGDVIALMTEATSRLTTRELIDRLGHARVNVASLNDVGQAADDAQLAASDGIFEFESASGPIKSVAPPFSLDKSPASVRCPPPELGADSQAVLGDFGFGAGEWEALKQRGAFG
ncbi:MAG: carnitine dehydratase [Rhodoferax sp.]|nr:carnitine dehydratase [Rhodoferax sp.]